MQIVYTIITSLCSGLIGAGLTAWAMYIISKKERQILIDKHEEDRKRTKRKDMYDKLSSYLYSPTGNVQNITTPTNNEIIINAQIRDMENTLKEYRSDTPLLILCKTLYMRLCRNLENYNYCMTMGAFKERADTVREYLIEYKLLNEKDLGTGY